MSLVRDFLVILEDIFFTKCLQDQEAGGYQKLLPLRRSLVRRKGKVITRERYPTQNPDPMLMIPLMQGS